MHKRRIAIVGGGITGTFAAYSLARLGAEPIVIEQDRIGGQASGHNAGGLNPLHGPGIPGPMQELALTALRLHLERWEEIGRLAGKSFGGRFVARMIVAMDDDEATQLAGAEALHNQTPGFSARWLTGRELRAAEPRLAPDAVGALWTDGNARVLPAPYTEAVARAAVRLGASILKARARGVLKRAGRVTGVLTDSGTVDCDGIVIATGPWCTEPARWLGTPLPVEPLKGELLLADWGGAGLPAEITWRSVGVYEAADRRVWLGGTEDRGGYEPSPTRSARERILAGVRRLLPGLAEPAIISHVAGLRPVTPDGLPIVGIPRPWENACVAVGSGRKGMLLSSALGLAAAQLLMLGETGIPIGACSLDRPGLQP